MGRRQAANHHFDHEPRLGHHDERRRGAPDRENALWRTSLRSRRRRYQCRPHCACPRRLLDSTVPGRRVDREPADGAARDAGVPFRVIPIAASTRESFTVNESRTAKQYRFVLPGPSLTVAEQEQCLDELRGAAASAAFVVASGSLPPGVAADYYQRVADICRRSSTPLILDTSGGGLQHISSGVFLLKASVRELRECVGSELLTEPEQLAAAHEFIDRGRAEVVVVSLGSQGALLATRHASHRFSSIPMTAVSGVGAGDAMVAAITVGLSRGWSLIKSVRLGNAAGAAMLLTPGTAACNRDDVERFFELAAEPTEVGQDQYVWHPIVNPEASP